MIRGAPARGVGHDLVRAPEAIAERGITLGKPLELLDETSSTNDVARRAAKNGAPGGATWVAEVQTAGKGRQGRAWISPRGENLLFSVLVRLRCEPSRLPPLALVAGVAVRDAVARAAPAADVRLKWPNDVLIEGRKVAGVLLEATLAGKRVDGLVVGIGINVHTRVFDPAIASLATSVALHAGAPPDRAEILADVLQGLDRDLELCAHRGLGLVHARLQAADALKDHAIRTDDGRHGVADGIDVDGRLRLRQQDGTLVRLAVGEVHLET